MQTTSFKFEAIGTHWQIDIPHNIEAGKRQLVLEKIIDLIEDFDKIYSRFRSDSLVTQMAHKKGNYLLPDNAQALLSLYKELYKFTDHAFTPLIGQVLVDAGYDAIYSLKPKKMYHPPTLEDTIDYKHPNIFIKKPALLDFGAAGKGYLIDLVSEVLTKEKLAYFCVDAGGDIFYYNKKNEKLRVGLEHPDNPSQVIGVATIHNQSICASAGNRRRWREFHHIMDPHTLTSTHKVKATWVIAQTALLADAIATCLFFVPAKKLQKYHFSYALVDENNRLEISKDFPAEIFTE
jgi:thiamine biosynthesis lipoprotein